MLKVLYRDASPYPAFHGCCAYRCLTAAARGGRRSRSAAASGEDAAMVVPSAPTLRIAADLD